MRNWLQGEFLLLTGASDGIGKELTKILVRDYGASVLGIGRSEEKMRALQEELGASFSYRLFDVSQQSAWIVLADELQSQNRVPALLINNAGVFPPLQRATSLSVERVEATLKTNFLGTMYAMNAFLPLSRPNGEKTAIVNVCSSAALCSVVGSATYTASKSAVKGFTEALQLEEGKTRYVGIVYPGTTATELFREDSNVKNSAMRKIACSPAKMARKIAKVIRKRKKRAVLGWDAKCMSFLAKLMPVKGPALIRWVMKKSKSQAFANVFTDNERGREAPANKKDKSGE